MPDPIKPLKSRHFGWYFRKCKKTGTMRIRASLRISYSENREIRRVLRGKPCRRVWILWEISHVVFYIPVHAFFQLEGSFRPGQNFQNHTQHKFYGMLERHKNRPENAWEINSEQHTHTSGKKAIKPGSKNSFPPGNHYCESQWLIIF